MSLALCENCGRPGRYIYTLDSGGESVACERCRPASGVSAREVGSDAPAIKNPPLTVPQAAQRENVSTRTVHRWLPALAASAGAWKVGAQWRIDPVALDARRAAPKPAKPKQRPKRRKRVVSTNGDWTA